MAHIGDLKSMSNKPKTIEEWLNLFPEGDREVIESATITNSPAAVYKIIRNLDEKHFPFTLSAFTKYARNLKENHGH